MAPAPNTTRSLLLLSIPLVGLAVVLTLLLRGGDEGTGPAVVRASVGDSAVRELAEPVVESRPPVAPPELEVAPPGAAPSDPISDVPDTKRRRVGDGTPSPRVGRVHGRVEPRVPGLLVLAGQAGLLPLDSAGSALSPERDAEPPAPVRRVFTDQDGEFELRDLPPGRLRLALRGEGHAPIDRDDLWLLAGEDLDLGVVELEPAVRIAGRIVDDLGAGVPEARLYALPARIAGAGSALGPAAASPLGKSGPLGEFAVFVAPGAWRLLVDAHERPVTLASGFTPADPGELTDLVVTLRAGPVVSGEVIDLDELLSPGEELTIGGFSLAAPLVDFAAARAAGIPPTTLRAWRSARTDAERRFSFWGLGEDETLLLRVLAGEPFDVPDAFAPDPLATAGELEVELFLRAPAALEAEVTNAATGAPVRDFRARLDGVSPRLARTSSRASWTDLRPWHAHPDPLYGDIPESVDLILALEAERFDLFESPQFRLRSGETTRLGTLALIPLPSVHLRVVDGRGDGLVEGAACSLEAIVPASAVGRAASRATTDGSGRARLTVTADNAADLVVRKAGYAPWRGRAPRSNGPDQPFVVELRRGGTLRVHAVDARDESVRAQVVRRKAGAETPTSLVAEYETALVDADGWAEFEDLGAGMWSVAARSLPRADLEAPLDPASLVWVGAGVAEGGLSEVEVYAVPVQSFELELELAGRPLAHALVRLRAGDGGFGAPHADARALAAWPVERCDELGRCRFERLPPGRYSLSIEHPAAPGLARREVIVEPGTVSVAIDLADTELVGVVLDEDGASVRARVSLLAFAGAWYEGLEIEAGASLFSIDPEPLEVASIETDRTGRFVFRGVPPEVPLVLRARTPRAAGDYFVDRVIQGRKKLGVQVTVSETIELSIAADLDPVPRVLPRLGLIALCRDHPWGRGVVARPLDGDSLQLHDRPRGVWQMRLVELASGHVVTSAGDWFDVDDPFDEQTVLLPWKAR